VLDAGRDASAPDAVTPGDARIDATVPPDVSADVAAVDVAADVTGPVIDAALGDVEIPEATPDGAADVAFDTTVVDVMAETSMPRDAGIDRVMADARADGSSRGDAADGSAAQEPTEDDSGCSCRTTRRTGSLGMYMLLGIAGALAIRRRRKSS
jgi:MYXO-CTERM domain-containing protein